MTPAAKTAKSVLADRAAGVVVASAAGDALGAGYEFGPPLDPTTPVLMNGGGGFGWKPGEWTDDTQMALAILTPLADGITDPAEIEAGFRAWFDSGPCDVGNQTRAVLGSAGPLVEAAARYLEKRPGSAGNGSLMRTGPVALAHPDDPEAIAGLARVVSQRTHPDPDCVDACVLWSVAIDHTIHHAPASAEPWDWAEAARVGLPQLGEDRRARWADLIDAAEVGVPLDFPENGWVIHAFQAALAAMCSTPVPASGARPRGDGGGAGTGGGYRATLEPADHLRLALEHAVRAGGDTDTVAAIAGSLLGARWGATALPFPWRRLLAGQRVYGQPTLDAADLERLARLAFNGGRPGAQGWPAVASMLPHYEQDWADAAKRAELGGVEFGNVHAVAAAIADGADAVISLCRMGTDEVPEGIEHHTLGLLDSTAEENPNLAFLLADTTDAINAMVDEGKRVYVHCVQAQNRTPTMAAAWLHHHGGMPADEALRRAGHALNQPKPFLAEAVRNMAGKPDPVS
ncbi:MAG: ADP-ribosylglycohydrolase family protein [Aquihabitans sp.]